MISFLQSVVEITGPRWRMVIGVANQIFFSVGSMLNALMGYSVRDFVKAQLVMILPLAVGLVFILWVSSFKSCR